MKLIEMNFNEKSIALIGNGSNTSLNGNIIDNFDIVVRFNSGILTDNISLNKEYVGSKTSLSVWNWWVIDGIKDNLTKDEIEIANFLEKEKIPVLFTARAYRTNERNFIKGIPVCVYNKMSNFDVISIGKIPNDIYDDCENNFKYKEPTSGLSLIFYLLKYYKPQNITLFNWTLDGKHYFDNEFYDIMTDKNKNSNFHSGLKEFSIIHELMKSYPNLKYG